MQRLFLGIPIPQSISSQFVAAVEKLQSITQTNSIKWVRPENYHITVLFIGNIEESHVPTLIKHIEEQIQSVKITFTLDKIVTAPLKKSPRMIWAQFVSGEFEALVNTFSNAIPEKKPALDAIPHVTLARFKPSIERKNMKLPHIHKETFEADAVFLYHSQLGPGGSKYTPIHEFSLR